ncbi:MAG: hypothetical protein R2789_03560 [Microthrixaceae bacterium]
MTRWVLVLVGLVLIAANGFFVAVEFSLLAARRGRIEQWVEDGRMGAVSALAGMRSSTCSWQRAGWASPRCR